MDWLKARYEVRRFHAARVSPAGHMNNSCPSRNERSELSAEASKQTPNPTAGRMAELRCPYAGLNDASESCEAA